MQASIFLAKLMGPIIAIATVAMPVAAEDAARAIHGREDNEHP
jgi:hypothetical protein